MSQQLAQNLLLGLVTVVICLGSVASATAQDERRRRGGDRGNWDPVEFVNRIDRDDNGVLDRRELNGRMRNYVRDDLGMDVSGNVSVQAIIQRVEQIRDTKAREEREQERDANRTVPKFGMTVERAPVPGFGIDIEDGPQGSLEESYEEGIVQAVRAYMDRFDEDKNGVLSENEYRPIIGMLGQDADQDNNQTIGEMELAEALKKRRERQQDEAGRGGDRGRNRGRGRDREGGDSGQPASTRPERPQRPTPPAPRRSAPTQTMTSRYSSYVDGVFEKYDADNNGQLSPEERKEVKLSLRDFDDDGQISRDEALRSLNERSSGGGGGAPASRGQRDRDRRAGEEGAGRGGDEARTGSRAGGGGDAEIGRDIRGFGRTQMPSQVRSDPQSELRRSGASDEFMQLDKNQDGQISMSEYARPSEWDDEMLETFRNLDANDDGLVTIEEFRGN